MIVAAVAARVADALQTRNIGQKLTEKRRHRGNDVTAGLRDTFAAAALYDS
jgi:hypothetical protein